MTEDTSVIVSLDNVSLTYASASSGVLALDEITLHIVDGEFVSIVGPSGCGKSTLLRIVADLLAPSTGDVRIRGLSPRAARERREIGMVFQSPVLFDWRSVHRNVELPLEVIGMSRAKRKARADAMLALVGLDKFAKHFPWQLSGGMQQRVSIARALAFDPVILLMDEPFGALDELGRDRMSGELQRIWLETGKTVLFITHSVPEAVFLSSRVLIMSPRPGRVMAEVEIDLPRPRDEQTRASQRYFELVTSVRQVLTEAET